jgi:hypothetical protein
MFQYMTRFFGITFLLFQPVFQRTKGQQNYAVLSRAKFLCLQCRFRGCVFVVRPVRTHECGLGSLELNPTTLTGLRRES